jgi:hypothetical protein
MRLLFCYLICLLSCQSQQTGKLVAIPGFVTDTLAIDSVDSYEGDCYDSFYASMEKIKDTSSYSILSGSETIPLLRFIKEELMEHYVHLGFKDLDGDGKKELILLNYTGGMHCCDEIYIYEQITANRYQQRVKLFAGNTCVSKDNIFSYGLYEQLGYFYSCYACLYEDSAKGLLAPPPLTFKYNAGKLVLTNDTASMNRIVIKNVTFLAALTLNPMKEDWEETGVRKMYALQIATWYFINGRDEQKTKRLFNQFYQATDRKKVWEELLEHIKTIETESTFTP